MRTLTALLLGGAIGAAATVYVSAPLIAQDSLQERTVYENLDLFITIFEQVRDNYVEEVDQTELTEGAVNGMLSSLDPHSSYLSPAAMEKLDEQASGEFSGLGIEVTQEHGYIKVISPIDNTPAAEAGLQPGDFITQLDGDPVLGLTLSEAVKKMRGPVGSDITLTIEREGEDAPFDVVITRATIKTPSARVRLEDDVVVIRITSFNEQTMNNIETGLPETLGEAGGTDQVIGAVLDLRNNPGGLLTTAVEVSDAFLETGEIVSIRRRDGQGAKRYEAENGDLLNGLPIVVLINGGSASASEIVAGALQDHGRAVVIGTKSFGKGSVQSIVPLSEEFGALRLTTARYYTPEGRSIQAQGILPDIVIQRQIPAAEDEELEDEEQSFFSEADLDSSLESDSLIDDQEAVAREQERLEAMAELRRSDSQMAYAIDLLNGLSTLSATR